MGISISYKDDLTSNYWGINGDLWIGTLISLGLNYNFNVLDDQSAHGFKPFAGVGYHGLYFNYGYNFVAGSQIKNMNIHQLTLRYYLPVIKQDQEVWNIE